MAIKRLKISQQFLIVLIASVFIPLFITAYIITNVNQQAVRAELRYSAIMTADSIYQRFTKNIFEEKRSIIFVAKSIEYIKSETRIKRFLSEIADASSSIDRIDIVKTDKNIRMHFLDKYFTNSKVAIISDSKENSILIYVKLNNNKYIREKIDIDSLQKELFEYLMDNRSQIYIINSNNELIMSYNGSEKDFKKIIQEIPAGNPPNQPLIFGSVKNQPSVFLKINEPDWAIIVATPKNLINYGIILARYRIILTLCIAALFIVIFGQLYSYSLNSNMKQLFKAITAITAGNYNRKIRLIKYFFTPYEIIYLSEQFNLMAQKINQSYRELQKANKELAKLDKLKSNLIDTVSHEFRTPLTSIKGYTSRLLRNDINLDETTKTKSLKVIKQQTERLSRLVEDLLVIPQIESALLRVFPSKVNIRDIFEDCSLSDQQKQSRKINLEIPDNFPNVFADPDRLTQVVINLLDNSIKYSPENSEIFVKASEKNNFAEIKIKNSSSYIEKEKLDTLFKKFTRIEDNLTRTTRGTGLGLFIVRGLIKTMGGEITLSCEDNFFEVVFSIPLYEDEE